MNYRSSKAYIVILAYGVMLEY